MICGHSNSKYHPAFPFNLLIQINGTTLVTLRLCRKRINYYYGIFPFINKGDYFDYLANRNSITLAISDFYTKQQNIIINNNL